MKFAVVLALLVCTVYAAPVAENEVSSIDEAELEAVVTLAKRSRSGIYSPATLDIRRVIERWAKGEIGLRKSFEALGELIRGKKNVSEVITSIKEVFGASSLAARALIISAKNLGLHSFISLINTILGRDRALAS